MNFLRCLLDFPRFDMKLGLGRIGWDRLVSFLQDTASIQLVLSNISILHFCFYSKNFQRLLRQSSYNFDALSGCHFEWKLSSFLSEISHVIPRQPHKSWKKISVSEVRKWDFKLCWCWLLASKPWSEGFGWHGDESRNSAHMKMKTLNPVYHIFLY